VCAVATLFFVGLFLGLGPGIVHVIYGEKWIPALPTLYVYTCAIAFGFLAPVLAAALDAVGKPQLMVRLSVGWTALCWVSVATAMSFSREPVTYAVAYCPPVVVGNLAVAWVVAQLLPEARLWPRVRAASFAAIVLALGARFGVLRIVGGPVTLVAAILACAAIFVGTLALVDRAALVELWGAVRGKPAAPTASAPASDAAA
jgi:O-antigen/teichoic acid export membrane protein